MAVRFGPLIKCWRMVSPVDYLNKVPFFRKVGAEIRGPRIQSISFCCVLWALFAQDIAFGWIKEKEVDSHFANVHLVVFAFLAIESFCHMLLTPSYAGSYFMVIDVVGTALLLPEVFIFQSSDKPQQAAGNDSILSVARAGRVARTAAMVRVSRLGKIFRVLRTARAMQCLMLGFTVWETAKRHYKEYKKKAQQKKKYEERNAAGDNFVFKPDEGGDGDGEEKEEKDSKPSIFGLKYANLVSQRVVIGVLVILAVVPQLDSNDVDYSRETGIELMSDWSAACLARPEANIAKCNAEMRVSVDEYLKRFKNTIQFEMNGEEIWRDERLLEVRRQIVLSPFQYTSGD